MADVIADMERMASLSPATALPWRANIAAVSRLAADNARLTRERDTLADHLLSEKFATRAINAEAERDSLRAQLAAASERYARAVADADEVRGRLVAERDAARGNAETQRLIRRSVEKQLTAVRDEGMRNYDHAIEQRDAALADVARLTTELATEKAEMTRSQRHAVEIAVEHALDHAERRAGKPLMHDAMAIVEDAIRALAAKGGA